MNSDTPVISTVTTLHWHFCLPLNEFSYRQPLSHWRICSLFVNAATKSPIFTTGHAQFPLRRGTSHETATPCPSPIRSFAATASIRSWIVLCRRRLPRLISLMISLSRVHCLYRPGRRERQQQSWSRPASGNTAALAALDRFNFAADCPAFAGLARFVRLYTGGSLAGRELALGPADGVAINWAGGLHHAKRARASGFCYINDIVLAILELLAYYPRVLSHWHWRSSRGRRPGSLLRNNRVMTLSLHKHGDGFFPGPGYRWSRLGTRSVLLGKCTPANRNWWCRLRVRLRANRHGSHWNLPTFSNCPAGGADSLGCDRLGLFNLSIRGHGDCVRFVHSFGLPVLMLGGGLHDQKRFPVLGRMKRQFWLRDPLSNDLPVTLYHSQFAPDHKLHQPVHLESDFANISTGAGGFSMGAFAASASDGLNALHYSSNSFILPVIRPIISIPTVFWMPSRPPSLKG